MKNNNSTFIPLLDLCQVLDSKRIPITAEKRKHGPYPYYGANGIQDYIDGYIFDDDLVLLAEDGGNFGSKDKPIAYRVSGKCWVNNHAHVLKPNENVNVDYLCYALMFYNTDNLINGATRAKLTQKAMKQIKIPMLSLDLQIMVVNKIKHVENLIKKRRQQNDLLTILIKSRFVEMFGDPVTNSKGLVTRKGSDFFTLTNGKFVPKEKRRNEGIPVYGGNGISWCTDEILVAHDTIVVGRVGFQSGNVHFVAGPLWVTDNAMYISDFNKDQYDLRFLCALMEHIDFTRFQDAGDLKKITQKPFMQMRFIAPSIQQQKSFIAFVEQTNKS